MDITQTAPISPRPTDIVVVASRENNLRDVSVRIPRDRITVFTGVSGSGKSSLVFDTIAAESQRQLADTYSSFVRNRMPQFAKPDADRIDNLPVSIVVDQRRFSANARSTVGTATDISPLLRLLFSRVGMPFVGYSNSFSFNDPHGMCPACEGLGVVSRIDEEALLDMSLSLDQGAIRFPTFAPGTWRWKRYVHSGLFDRAKPIREYGPEELELLLRGENITPPNPDPDFPKTGVFEGIIPRFRRSYLTSDSAGIARGDRAELARVVSHGSCPACAGTRLSETARSCLIGESSIADYLALPVTELATRIETITEPSVETVVTSIRSRLGDLERVGLGYLTLDRASGTLSGGEAQRVKLVRHLGSSLTGLLYILDEPSTGLHPADVHRLNELLRDLRDRGNTVLVVEHDPDVIHIADHVVDMGPGAGVDGGTNVYQGDLAGLLRADTPTGRYLREPRILKPDTRRPTGSIRSATPPATICATCRCGFPRACSRWSRAWPAPGKAR